MWFATSWLLLIPACSVRKESSLGTLGGTRPQDDQQPSSVEDGIGSLIKRGPDVPIPGEFNITGLPLQWHIQHYVALLQNYKLFVKYAMGNEQYHVAKFLDWPFKHKLFDHFTFLRGPPVCSTFVKEYIARYTLVMKIWILQVIRGLEAGRLGEQVEKWFKTNSLCNRAYLNALLQRMYVAFGHLCYKFDPNVKKFAEVRYVRPRTCATTHWRTSGDFFDMWLGQNFFNTARHDLRSWNTRDATRVGTLLHEVSHLVWEEDFAVYSSGAWGGDAPGRKCGDDGRLGTADYAYGHRVLDLGERDARHNADSIQFFIENSVISEIDGGHAIEITVDGNVKGVTTVTTSRSTTSESPSERPTTSLSPATTTGSTVGQVPPRVVLLVSLSALGAIWN